MSLLEKEIRENFARMNQPISRKSINHMYGNTCETWEALSQYGFPMAYFPTQGEAEQYTIQWYKAHMWLIRQ